MRTKMAWPVIIILLFLLYCSQKEADLEEADQLIQSGQFNEALSLLREEMNKEYADTSQYDRIRHRIFLAQKGLFFKDVEALSGKGAWEPAGTGLKKLDSILQSLPQDSSKLYRFDYYLYKARVDSVLNGKEEWAKTLFQATHYPLGNPEQMKDIFIRLAFYHGKKENFDKARDMMAYMLRTIPVGSLDGPLKSALYFYMEGKFSQALGQLQKIPSNEKDRHWKRMERFLERYHEQLSTQNRFKLW